MTGIIDLLALCIVCFALGTGLTFLLVVNKLRAKVDALDDANKKMNEFYDLLIRWMKVHRKGGSLASFFIGKGYKTLAIYGMRELGLQLLQELKNTGAEVKYCIDKDADNIHIEIPVYKPEDDLEAVDVIVITAIHYYNDIEPVLRDKLKCDVYSLDDVIYELMGHNAE